MPRGVGARQRRSRLGWTLLSLCAHVRSNLNSVTAHPYARPNQQQANNPIMKTSIFLAIDQEQSETEVAGPLLPGPCVKAVARLAASYNKATCKRQYVIQLSDEVTPLAALFTAIYEEICLDVTKGSLQCGN